MLSYQLDTLKGPDGPKIASLHISASDDVEAVRSARALAEGRPMELWCGNRKVKTFPASAAEVA